MHPNREQVERLLRLVPVLCALVFHGNALDRWALVVPAMLAMGVLLIRAPSTTVSSRRWYVYLGIGLVLGTAIPSADVTAGPLPPAAAAAITGMAVAGVLLATAASNMTVSWVWAWVLITVSGKTAMNDSLRIVLILFLLATVVAAVQMAGLKKPRLRTLAVVGAFVSLLVPSTLGIAWGIRSIDRLFMHSVQTFSSGDSSSGGTTGLGNSLSVSSQSTIRDSLQPVLEVSAITGYLRARVMDTFDGYRWTTSVAMLKKASDPEHDLNDVERQVELFFLQDTDGAIPTPAGTTNVSNGNAKRVGGWIYQGEPQGVTLTVGGRQRELLGKEDIQVTHLLALPEELANAMSLHADELVGDIEAPLAKARAIQSFFHQNFQYSLTTDLQGEDHPLVTLVRQRRPAYCVYFASAMAVMLRTQGVPARVVSGFVPGEVNPVSGRVLVRQRDAHAWVEVWDPNEQRFIAFDPTPPDSLQETLNHDEQPNTVIAMLQAFRSYVFRLWMIARSEPLTAIRMLALSPWFWLFLAWLVGYWIRRSRFHSKPESVGSTEVVDDRLLAVYERYLGALRSKGISVGPSETDEEVIGRLKSDGPKSIHEAAHKFLIRYQACRFGRQAVDSSLDELSKLESNAEPE